jgi:hypothetical protein
VGTIFHFALGAILVLQSPSLRDRLVSRLSSTGLKILATQEGLATAGKIAVGRGRHPALDLARSGFGNVGGIHREGAVGRPRVASDEPHGNGRRHGECDA